MSLTTALIWVRYDRSDAMWHLQADRRDGPFRKMKGPIVLTACALIFERVRTPENGTFRASLGIDVPTDQQQGTCGDCARVAMLFTQTEPATAA